MASGHWPKILANRLIAIFTIPAASLRFTVSLQLIHQMDLSSQWVHQSQLDVGFEASNHFNCMSKVLVLAVYKKSYQDQLEFVKMGSIYQIQSAHHGQFFHEIYKVASMYHSSMKNLLVVQCLQLPTFLEPEALWTKALAQEGPAFIHKIKEFNSIFHIQERTGGR